MTTCLTKIGGANAGGPRQGAILLGCTGPAASSDTFIFSRKRHVEVDGKVADAVLGQPPLGVTPKLTEGRQGWCLRSEQFRCSD